MPIDRNDALNKIIEKSRKRTQKALKKKLEKRSKIGNTTHLFYEWCSLMKERNKNVDVPKWSVKERTLLKSMIKEYDFDSVVKMFIQYFKTFNARIKNREAIPSVGFFYSIRGVLKAEIDGIVKEPKSRQDKLKRADFKGGEDLQDGWDGKEKEYNDEDLKDGW